MSKKPFNEKNNKWKKFSEQQETETEQGGDPSAQDESESEPALEHASDLGLEYPNRQRLEDQLTAMEQEVSRYKDQHLRGMAQLKNAQERAERDVVNAHKFGNEKLIGDLLPVLDSLTRGLESVQSQDAANNSVREGLQLTLDLLNKVLAKHGAEMINPEPGTTFNPAMHEAMTLQKVPNAAPNTILQVLQPGYVLHGRVLRAAMVIVAG